VVFVKRVSPVGWSASLTPGTGTGFTNVKQSEILRFVRVAHFAQDDKPEMV